MITTQFDKGITIFGGLGACPQVQFIISIIVVGDSISEPKLINHVSECIFTCIVTLTLIILHAFSFFTAKMLIMRVFFKKMKLSVT